jgi:outer membrane protein TolC
MNAPGTKPRKQIGECAQVTGLGDLASGLVVFGRDDSKLAVIRGFVSRQYLSLFCLSLSVVMLNSLIAPSGGLAASADPSIMNIPQRPAQEAGPTVALSAVFNESLLNSPRAANIRAHLRITRAAYAHALTLPNPSFFFLEDTAQRARQIGASVPIEPPWKLAFRVLLAKAQIKQTDLEIQKNLWQLRNTVRRAYLDAVIALETAETLDDLRRLAAELQSIAQRRFGTGDVAGFDVYRAELASVQAEADFKQSEKRLEQAKQRLSVLMGRHFNDVVSVPHVPPFQLRVEANELLPDLSKEFPSLDELIKEALKNRLELKVVNQTIAVNERGLRLAKANILPNPQLNIGSSYSGNPPEGPATRGYFIGVTQEVPVLNFQQGELARLRAVNSQLKRELEATKNIVTEEVVTAYQQLSAARERIGYFQNRILPASDKVAKLARRGYEVGQNDMTATLAAQQSNIQTKAAYLDAVRTYQQALTDLEQAVGHPL